MINFVNRFPSMLHRLQRQQLGWFARYVGAAGVIALCCAVRVQLPVGALPYLYFIPGLMFIGFWFGVGPSAMGCALAVLAAQYFFIGPLGFNDGWTTWINSLSFGLVTFSMTVVCVLFRRSLDSLYQVNQTLEEEVERRTQERDGIWNASPDLICTLSEQGDVLAMNPAWHKHTGRTEQELKGGGFFNYISGEQIATALKSLENRSIVEIDTQGTRSDGKPLYLNWRLSRRHGLFFAVARDVTLNKERQDVLDQVRSELQQSQKMEAVGQLTGGIAHDFNNLLTVISGSLDMIEHRVAQGSYTRLPHYISLAQGASTRAASLTHRLLAYARRHPLASKAVDPALQIREMQELIARTLTPRIQLELLTPPVGLLCFCDAHQLENAVLNLCINARDAMPHGGNLKVEVSKVVIDAMDSHTSCAAGEYVRICVSDTGTGMPPSVLDRAFDPFFTTKPLGSGTGLGLSMVYGFARQSSGDAQIESVLGKGTAVSLMLPLYLGSVPASTPEAQHIPEITSTPPGRGSALLVDDEPAIRELLGEMLETMGYEVVTVPTATEAQQLIKILPSLDLLVTDIGLPGGISGDELAQWVIEIYPTLKVLFISGLSDAAIENEIFKNRNVRLLAKPFAMSDARDAVEQLVISQG